MAKRSPKTSLERMGRLRRLRDVFTLAQIAVICLIMYGFYWSATEGPFHKIIFEGSFLHRAGFAFMVILTPALILKAFPLPFSRRLGEASSREWLLVERIKTASMVVIAGVLAHKLVFSTAGAPGQSTVGKVVVVLCAAYAGWILRHAQKSLWRGFWQAIKGERRGRGLAEIKDLLRRQTQDEISNDSARLRQDNEKRRELSGKS